MSEKPVRIPGPDHPIAIEPAKTRLVVKVAGRVVADTRAALTLQEANYPPVQYVPRQDVDMSLLTPTDHTSYCSYKGDASYFSIPLGGERSANAIWSYANPYDAVSAIREYVAFYPQRVESIEELPID